MRDTDGRGGESGPRLGAQPERLAFFGPASAAAVTTWYSLTLTPDWLDRTDP
jgi:hypothetical protein